MMVGSTACLSQWCPKLYLAFLQCWTPQCYGYCLELWEAHGNASPMLPNAKRPRVPWQLHPSTVGGNYLASWVPWSPGRQDGALFLSMLLAPLVTHIVLLRDVQSHAGCEHTKPWQRIAL